MAVKTVFLGARIPEDLKEKLENEADKNHRSMVGQLIAALEERYGKKK